TDVAGDLVGTGALLGRAKDVVHVEPLVKRHLGGFEHGADRHGVLLAAIVALYHALADGAARMRLGYLALLRRQAASVHGTTMRADRAFRPVQRLKVLAGCIFVLKAGFENVHGSYLWP